MSKIIFKFLVFPEQKQSNRSKNDNALYHHPLHTSQVNERKLLRNELLLSIPDDIPEPFSVSCAKLLFRRMCDPTDPLLLKSRQTPVFLISFRSYL